MKREEQITHLLYDGGGIDQCRGILFNLLDSDYIETDLVFDVIENILKNNKRTIKENYITPIDRCDYFLNEGKKYACLDNDLKFCVAEKGAPEWAKVSHVMTQMNVSRALELINNYEKDRTNQTSKH